MSPEKSWINIVTNAAALGLVLGILWSLFTEQRPASAIVRGDFPAFYSMALIAGGHDSNRLYDLDLQREVQNSCWPGLEGTVLPAAYPPYVAFILRPLAALKPPGAHLVWSLFMVFASFIAVRVVCRINKNLHGLHNLATVSFFLCAPVLLGVIGGQVSALSVLLYSLIVLTARFAGGRADIALGFLAGAWMFKPHYSLCVVFIFFLQRRWIALVSWAFICFVLWGMGTAVLGSSWPQDWVKFARTFAHVDLVSNAGQMTGIVPFIFSCAKGRGDAALWSWVSVGAAILIPIGLSIAHREAKSADPKNELLPFLALGPLLLLFAPAVNFYDLAILLVPLLIMYQPTERSERFISLGVIAASHLCLLARDRGMWGESFILAVVLSMLLWWRVQREWPRGTLRIGLRSK